MDAFRASQVSASSAAAAGLPPYCDEPAAIDAGGRPSPAVQRDIWLSASLSVQASLALNHGLAIELHGALRIDALRAALDELVQRHEALRVRLADHGQQLLLADSGAAAWQVHDLRALAPARRELRREQIREAAMGALFDLRRGPLLRAELLRIEDQCVELLLTTHAAVCDRWSLGLLGRELSALYTRRLGGDIELPAPDSFIEYADEDALRGDSPQRRAAEHYWRSRYRDPSRPLTLPTDRPRPAQRRLDAARVDHRLDAATAATVRRLAARHDCSPFAVLLATQAVWLHRLGGSTDLVVAVPAADQPRSGRTRLVGPCSHWLPIRIAVDAADGFDALVTQVELQLRDADLHAGIGLSELLGMIGGARDPSRPALAAVSFDHCHGPGVGARAFPELQAEYRLLPRQFEPFELGLEVLEQGGELTLHCHYAAALYDGLTIGHWLHAFEQLLLSAERTPAAPLGTLPMVAGDMLAELRALQPPATDVGERWVHRQLEQVMRQSADRIALRAIDATLSYRQLLERSGRLAQVMRSHGLRPGGRVGLLLDRCADAIAAILAALRSGAAWVPLDPDYPRERLEFMVEDASLDLLLSRSDLLRGGEYGTATLLLDRDAGAIDSAPADFDGVFETDADPWQTAAYLIYTSGSTGRPKGVEVPHAALACLLHSMPDLLGLGPRDRQLAVVTLSFDVSVQDILLPLSIGAELVLATGEQARDPHALTALVGTAGVTAMEATPTTWRIMLDAGFRAQAGFRAMTVGEPLPMDIAERLIGQGAEVWNLYGPTEATVHAAYWKVVAREAGMSIGRPIPNWRVWVLDEHDQPCPLGVPGELCIAGEGVALGYLGRADLNAERFVAEPDCLRRADEPHPRMYRTGDVGRWCADGLLECMGRKDGQIKLRGHRIETGEIEVCLRGVDGITDAAVVLRPDRNGDAQLVAYVETAPDAPVDAMQLRARLSSFLPAFMVPQRIVPLSDLPRTPSGKTDRGALPAPGDDAGQAIAGADTVAPNTPLEHVIHALWVELLGRQSIGIRDDFFAHGGHSLLAVRLFHALAERTGVNLPLATLYRAPSIEALADAFASAGANVPHRRAGALPTDADPWHPLVPIRTPEAGGNERPLFLVHAVGGNVMNYRGLAARLPAGLPVYGLQAVGLDGVTAPLRSIEAMAERYLQEIVAVQPHGPYRIGGGSMGGVIAFEIARRLRLCGAEIEHLLLFDSDLRHTIATGVRRQGMLTRLSRDGDWRPQGVLRSTSNWLAQRGRRWLDRLRLVGYRMLRRPLPHAMRYRVLQAVNHEAYFGYRPAPYDGPITLFRASELASRHLHAYDACLGWSTVAGARLRIEAVPGTHNTVIEQPELARGIARVLGIHAADPAATAAEGPA